MFRSNDHRKIGSVFHKAIASDCIPSRNVEGVSHVGNVTADAQTGVGFGDPAENKLVEVAAVRAVVKTYQGDGWSVRSVERDKCGFDLECTKNGSVENVEVNALYWKSYSKTEALVWYLAGAGVGGICGLCVAGAARLLVRAGGVIWLRLPF